MRKIIFGIKDIFRMLNNALTLDFKNKFWDALFTASTVGLLLFFALAFLFANIF
jgi:hypothetical protein